MRQGTINNYIKFSQNFGGVRKCYEGKPEIAVGGFMCKPELMPAYPNAMAAGTLVKYDETKGVRSIVPLYTFKVKEVDATNSKITVEKYETGSVAKVGMKLIVVGNDLTVSATYVHTVSAVDSSDPDFDVITVDVVTGVTTGAVLAEGVSTTTGEGQSAVTTNLVKVIPNGLTYCDNRLDPDAYAIDIDPVYFCIRPVLERRMPPLTESLKKALRDNGCYFNFSPRV